MATITDLNFDLLIWKDDAKIIRMPCNFLLPYQGTVLNFFIKDDPNKHFASHTSIDQPLHDSDDGRTYTHTENIYQGRSFGKAELSRENTKYAFTISA